MLLANFADAPLLRQQTREGVEIGRQSALQPRGAGRVGDQSWTAVERHEIKREMAIGQLKAFSHASLPAIAVIGVYSFQPANSREWRGG